MTHMTTRQALTWQRTIAIGAGMGVAFTIAYAAIFALYAIVRSSLTISAAMSPNTGLFGTLIANAVSIALASFSSAMLLSLWTALLGATIACVTRGLDAYLNAKQRLPRTLVIGFVVALLFVALFDFAVEAMMGRTLNSLGIETYLFWFGYPAILQILGGIVGAWYLHQLNATLGERSPALRNEVQYVR